MSNLATRIYEYVKGQPQSVSPKQFESFSGEDLEKITDLFERMYKLRFFCINRPTRENGRETRAYYTRREFRPLFNIFMSGSEDEMNEALAAYDQYQLLASRDYHESENSEPESIGAIDPVFHEEDDVDSHPDPSNRPDGEWA